MAFKQVERWAALALAAMLLLSACGTGADAGPTPGPGGQPDAAPSQSAPEQEPAQSEPQPAEPGQPAPASDSVTEETPEPEPEPEPIVGLMPLAEPVEEEWFADAVFLGDSRTDGLMLYSGIKSASFLSHKGLSVFNLDDKQCIDVDGKELTVLEALALESYAKVYLMLGINELGYPGSSFREAYQDIVRQIKEAQPDAVIYLQTIIPVNEKVGKSKGMSQYITNERVLLFNDIIAEIAEEEEVAVVDVDQAFWTDEGCIAADNTSDGVHLTRQGYVAWFEYLKSHTGTTPVIEQEPEPSGEPEPPEDDPAETAGAGDPEYPPEAEPSAPASAPETVPAGEDPEAETSEPAETAEIPATDSTPEPFGEAGEG